MITQAMEEKAKKLEMELHAEMEAIEVDRKELQYLPEDHAFLLRLCGVTCRSGSKAHTPTAAVRMCASHCQVYRAQGTGLHGLPRLTCTGRTQKTNGE